MNQSRYRFDPEAVDLSTALQIVKHVDFLKGDISKIFFKVYAPNTIPETWSFKAGRYEDPSMHHLFLGKSQGAHNSYEDIAAHIYNVTQEYSYPALDDMNTANRGQLLIQYPTLFLTPAKIGRDINYDLRVPYDVLGFNCPDQYSKIYKELYDQQ